MAIQMNNNLDQEEVETFNLPEVDSNNNDSNTHTTPGSITQGGGIIDPNGIANDVGYTSSDEDSVDDEESIKDCEITTKNISETTDALDVTDGTCMVVSSGSIQHEEEEEEEDEKDEDTPSIQQQREIIQQILREESTNYEEGTVVNVISEVWMEKFDQGEYEDYKEAKQALGAIDTSCILSHNGVFDFNNIRLTIVPRTAFQKLVEWYGLTSRSTPIETHLVQYEQEVTETNEEGEEVKRVEYTLAPEFNRPYFTLHHLTVNKNPPEYSRYNVNSRYSSIPDFTVPKLFKLEDVVEEAIEQLYRKESYDKTKDQHRDSKFRVWVIFSNDSPLNYNITPDEFHALPDKRLIKKDLFRLTLKESQLNGATLVIEEKSGSDTNAIWPSFEFLNNPVAPSDGRIGLQNLGNTCFMNSALQCLVHIPELTQYFLLDCFQKELNVDNPLGMSGKIAQSFANLIHNLFGKKSPSVSSYTPREFKSTIGHFNSMFAGYQQQDSQEFLAFLLDGLHEDLNRILQKPFTEKPELNDKDSITPENIKLLAEKSWEQHKLRNDSIIVDLFTGLYKSTLVCPECQKISITFDPFSDLTLPLPSESHWEGKVVLFLKSGSLKSFEVELPKTSTYSTLKHYVADKLELDTNDLFTAEIYNHQFYNNFDSSDSQSGYLPISDLISANDTIVMYEIPQSEEDLVVPVFNTITTPNNSPSAFGCPFFITLNKEERQSFGVIRKKLEAKYEQLTTLKVFSELRKNEKEGDPFTKKDFVIKKANSNSNSSSEAEDIEEDGYDSDISLANPVVPGDYCFAIKIWEESRNAVRQPRRSFRSSHNRLSHNSSSSSADTKIWMPRTLNSFSKLTPLMDSLNAKKKSYYTFNGKVQEESQQEDVEGSEDSKTFQDTEAMDVDTNAEVDEIDKGMDAGLLEINEDSPSVNKEKTEGLTNDDDDDDDEELNLFNETGPSKVPAEAIKSNCASDGDDGAVFDHSEDCVEPVKRYDLLRSGLALVCEWSYEDYEFLFSGLDEDGGKNTWDVPEVLPNTELETNRVEREANKGKSLTLDQCLKLFSKPEVLGEQDFWYCSQCKEHRQASKQIQIWSTPDILSIHLKRFENQRTFSDKIDSVVEFPIEGLDMKPYLASYENVTVGNNDTEELYDLVAVDNHYGGLGGGHYTAYAKNFVDNQWYYYDDSRVSPTSPEKSITGAAYLLFYRKRSSKYLGGEKINEMLKEAREQREQFERQQYLQLRRFYEENRESDNDEDNDLSRSDSNIVIDDIGLGTLEDVEDLEEDEEAEEAEEDAYSTAREMTSSAVEIDNPASAVSTVTAGYDSDDVASISVPVRGSNTDENHRKLLKLVAAKSKTTDQFQLNGGVSDVESSAVASPVSIVSDEVQ